MPLFESRHCGQTFSRVTCFRNFNSARKSTIEELECCRKKGVHRNILQIRIRNIATCKTSTVADAKSISFLGDAENRMCSDLMQWNFLH
ncbi:hypothetical protein CH373_12485 [Leptospira perolatii]|uniref:Uncharacterized protein n=1 Tax=Leptospira perolatii TaxID=2023191 RepID=A0A2M9ZLG3_9LEPT|nr:hypothetical protein CH360_06485 [Leptospira perolatii]PJZ72869.1 hypothetical protein CH373_12485 [Leptospira perolatii]